MVKHRIGAALLALLLCMGIATPHAKAEEGTSLGIIGGADGPTAVYVTSDGEALNDANATIALDIEDMLSLLGLDEGMPAIGEIADPDAFLDAYEATLTEYFALLDELFAGLDELAVMPVGDSGTMVVPTKYTAIYPGSDLRITSSMQLVSSDPGVLGITMFAPAAQPDVDREGLLLRNVQSSAVRIDGVAPGSARLVYILRIDASIGGKTRAMTGSYALTMTVGDDASVASVFGVQPYGVLSAYDIVMPEE